MLSHLLMHCWQHLWSWLIILNNHLWWDVVYLNWLDQTFLKAVSHSRRRFLLATNDRIGKVRVSRVDSGRSTSHHGMMRHHRHIAREVIDSRRATRCGLHSLICADWHHIVLVAVIHQVCLWWLDGPDHDPGVLRIALLLFGRDWIHCTLQLLQLDFLEWNVLRRKVIGGRSAMISHIIWTMRLTLQIYQRRVRTLWNLPLGTKVVKVATTALLVDLLVQLIVNRCRLVYWWVTWATHKLYVCLLWWIASPFCLRNIVAHELHLLLVLKLSERDLLAV